MPEPLPNPGQCPWVRHRLSPPTHQSHEKEYIFIKRAIQRRRKCLQFQLPGAAAAANRGVKMVHQKISGRFSGWWSLQWVVPVDAGNRSRHSSTTHDAASHPSKERQFHQFEYQARQNPTSIEASERCCARNCRYKFCTPGQLVASGGGPLDAAGATRFRHPRNPCTDIDARKTWLYKCFLGVK